MTSVRIRRWRRRAESTTGAALVEAAVVSPFLLLLVFGAGDFGRVMYYGITLENAARAGAAFGSQSTGHLTDSTNIRTAAQQEAQNIGSITVNSSRICECPAGTAVSCGTSSCAGYGAPLAFVEVTATTTFTPLTGGFPGIPASTPLSRSAKVRAQ